MSFLFLCCCRPFLRDPTGNREYYDLLGIEKDASADEVKRAYKRQSLALHPDKLAQRGQTPTAEAQAKFQRMKEGYEVLSDPKRRRLYDELGEAGLRILENPQGADMTVLGQNFLKSSITDRCALFSLVLAITSFILLWPVLLCLEADQTINVRWTALWTPLWVCDAFILLVYVLAVAMGRRAPPEGLEEEWHDDFPDRILALLQFSCNLIFQIFLTMKLDDDLSWQWSKVFAPWIVWEGFQMIKNLRVGCQRAPTFQDLAGMGEEIFLTKRIEIESARTGLVNGVLRVVFIALTILKLDGQIAVNWWTVFVPLWVYFGFALCSLCRDYTLAKARLAALARGDVEAGAEGEHEHMREEAEFVASRSGMTCCSSIIMLTMALLAVGRIQGADYSVFIVFIPVFIIVGCFTCIMGCGICCVSDTPTEGEGTPLNPGAHDVPVHVEGGWKPAAQGGSGAPVETQAPPIKIPMPPPEPTLPDEVAVPPTQQEEVLVQVEEAPRQASPHHDVD